MNLLNKTISQAIWCHQANQLFYAHFPKHATVVHLNLKTWKRILSRIITLTCSSFKGLDRTELCSRKIQCEWWLFVTLEDIWCVSFFLLFCFLKRIYKPFIIAMIAHGEKWTYDSGKGEKYFGFCVFTQSDGVTLYNTNRYVYVNFFFLILNW